MDEEEAITVYGEDAVNRFILDVTIPLLADVETDRPRVLGTCTSFVHEGRNFLVTADHILKENEDDLASPTIDIERIAFPGGPFKSSLHRLGSVQIHRHVPEAHLDVAVIEVLDPDAKATLLEGWGALGFDQVGAYPTTGTLMVNGFLLEGATVVEGNIGQKFLAFRTEPLNHIPPVSMPNPTFDRFLLLEREGEFASGSTAPVPNLKGMSGASVWSLQQTASLWSPSLALKIVGVQCEAKRGHWIRCTDWTAVLQLLRDPRCGFGSPP